MLRKEVTTSVLIAALLVTFQLVGCGGQGRIRAERSQIVGSYVTKLDHGSERLELKGDGTYIQEVTSQSRPLTHTGRWHVENRFLSGSDVILTNAAVSEGDETLPLRFGDLTLNVHDHFGKVALARNEAADWYFERAR